MAHNEMRSGRVEGPAVRMERSARTCRRMSSDRPDMTFSHTTRSAPTSRLGQEYVARHVIDTHFKPSFEVNVTLRKVA
jgi:hypothetical protein